MVAGDTRRPLRESIGAREEALGGDDLIPVVAGIGEDRQSDLAQAIEALGRPRLSAHLGDGRQQQAGQDRDDRDHDQDFDQGEGGHPQGHGYLAWSGGSGRTGGTGPSPGNPRCLTFSQPPPVQHRLPQQTGPDRSKALPEKNLGSSWNSRPCNRVQAGSGVTPKICPHRCGEYAQVRTSHDRWCRFRSPRSGAGCGSGWGTSPLPG